MKNVSFIVDGEAVPANEIVSSNVDAVEGPTYKNVSFIVDGVAWPAIEHRSSIVHVIAGPTKKKYELRC